MEKIETKIQFDEEFEEYFFIYNDTYIWIEQFMKTKNGEKINFLPTGEMIILKKISYDKKVIEYIKTGVYR